MLIFSIISPTSSQETSQDSISKGQTRTLDTNKHIEYLSPSSPNFIAGGAWRPDGSYAILVGNGIQLFDGENFELLDINISFDCVAWKPDNDLSDGYQGYALLAGYSLMKFDGEKFIELSHELPAEKYITKIAWKPDGSYALLFGTGYSSYGAHEVLLKFDGNNLIDLTQQMGTYEMLYGLCWHPEGDYAIIVGCTDYYDYETNSKNKPVVIKFDGNNFFDISDTCNFPGALLDISWKPNDDHAIIVGCDYKESSSPGPPLIIKYNGTGFTQIQTEIGDSYALKEISWHPLGNYAIIRGTSNYDDCVLFNYTSQQNSLVTIIKGLSDLWLSRFIWHPFQNYAIIPLDDGLHKVFKNDIICLNKYLMGPNTSPSDLSWKSDGSYALIVGMQFDDNRRGDRQSYPQKGGLWKFDGTSITDLTSMLGSTDPLEKCSWQPDSSNAFIFSVTGSLFKYNELEITDISNNIGNPDYINDVEWNPNGETALILTSFFDYDLNSYSGHIWEYNATADNWTNLLSNSTWHYECIAWHPSGSHAMISTTDWDDNSLIRYNLSAFTVIDIGYAPYYITDMEWKPDGTELTIIGNYQYTSVIATYDGTFSSKVISSDQWILYFVDFVWSPDGSYALIVSHYNIFRWENGILEIVTYDSPAWLNSDPFAWYPQDGVIEKLKGSGFLAYPYGIILRYGNIKPKFITDFPIRTVESGQVSYEFRAHYIDWEDDAPADGYPKLNVYSDPEGTIPYAGSPFVMSASETSDNDMTDGKTFTKSLPLLDGNMNYSFQVEVAARSGDTTSVYSRLIRFGELDFDGDGYMNELDAFPYNRSEWLDSDGDGYGDNTDEFPNDPTEWIDTDGDGYGDNIDDFPDDPSEWLDTDGDGYGDNSDEFPDDSSEWLDSDGDGYGNNIDKFPYNGSEWNDTDRDGIGDNADRDDDNDGYDDELELAEGTDPLNNNSFPQDFDNDLIPDSIDVDDDNDGYNDTLEKVEGTDPFNSNSMPLDFDNDLVPDSIDPDIDGDEVPNEDDEYPFDSLKSEPEEEVDYIAILYSLTGFVILIILFIVLFLFVRKQKKERKGKEKELPPRISLEPRVIPQVPQPQVELQPQGQAPVPKVKTQPTIKDENA